jgi:hypothetical protein
MSDRGIVMQRRLLTKQIQHVQAGGDPLGVTFDPAQALFQDPLRQLLPGDARGGVGTHHVLRGRRALTFVPWRRKLTKACNGARICRRLG